MTKDELSLYDYFDIIIEIRVEATGKKAWLFQPVFFALLEALKQLPF